MGLLRTLWGCTVLPINTQGCGAFAEINFGWGWVHSSKHQGRAAGVNGLAAGRFGRPADLLNADFIAKLFCLPLRGDSTSLLCNLAITWRHQFVDKIHTHQTHRHNTCFYFLLFLVSRTGWQRSQKPAVTGGTVWGGHIKSGKDCYLQRKDLIIGHITGHS